MHIDGEPFEYEVEATAGLTASDGSHWFGTHFRWRSGVSGRWSRFNVVDLHPFDSEGVEAAARLYITDWLALRRPRQEV